MGSAIAVITSVNFSRKSRNKSVGVMDSHTQTVVEPTSKCCVLVYQIFLGKWIMVNIPVIFV
jgi:hypothetical protein